MTGKDRRTIYDIPQYTRKLMTGYYAACEGAPYPDESRGGLLVLFEGGFRIGEAVRITLDQCSWNDEAIAIYDAPVLKKQKSKRNLRDIFIKLDEKNPLGYEFKEYLESCRTKYLLPGRKKFTREVVVNRATSTRTLYDRIISIDPRLFPHALRGLRATMLVLERDFSVQDLVSWFQWSNADIALHYSRTRDLSRRVGIDDVPLRRLPT